MGRLKVDKPLNVRNYYIYELRISCSKALYTFV